MQVNSTPAQISAPRQRPELNLNQDRMWAAFNGGKPVDLTNRIYSQMPEIALQGIAQIVEKGNRMGDLRINKIRFLILRLRTCLMAPRMWKFSVRLPPTVWISILLFVHWKCSESGNVDIQVQTHEPEINYQRGHLNVYMEQYPSMRFNVSSLDVKV